ncbi:MAG TPA: hypothetical protein VF531_09340 [Bacillota bacterium]
MKISEYQVSMNASHEYQEMYRVEEVQKHRMILPAAQQKTKPPTDLLDFSKAAQRRLEQSKQNSGFGVQDDPLSRLSPRERVRFQTLDWLLGILSGGRLRLRMVLPVERPKELVQVERKVSYQESEKLSFQASGVIKTADGKTIDFSAELNMSREFASQYCTSVTETRELTDPLVVNFEGRAAELNETKVSFDLDSDGSLDQISFLKSGSGFLALDRNADGTINNGRELFGPGTGNGFGELTAFDQDHNGWIDENDAIYEKLRIWTKDPDGNDRLFALGEKGVGAIYLGNLNTQFSMKNAANQSQGELRRSGVFLREDGSAGTVQQIDLVI